MATKNKKGGIFAWHLAQDQSGINGNNNAVLDAKGTGPVVVTVVLLAWLGSKQKYLQKYVEWYNSRGIHAITFCVEVRDVIDFNLGKEGGKQVVLGLANEVISWLSSREEDGRERFLIVHSFSNTGRIAYGYILAIMQGREGLTEKIKGCVVDSGGGALLSPKAWAAAHSVVLLPKCWSSASSVVKTQEINQLTSQTTESKMQGKKSPLIETMLMSILEKLFSVILRLPYADRKLQSIDSILNQPSYPQLFLYSTADKLVPFQSIESYIENQRRMGRNAQSYNFGSSSHVNHYRDFPDIYSSVLQDFLKECIPMVCHSLSKI